MKELERLYKEIHPKVYAFFFVKTFDKTAAEDLTHDVFYEAVKGLHYFEGHSTLQTWLFSIAKNVLKKYYRSKKYRVRLEKQLAESPSPPSASPEEVYLLKEGTWDLAKRIGRLDDLSREIVILRVYGELSFKEIGDVVGQSENYARVAFHRSKLKLQKETRAEDE